MPPIDDTHGKGRVRVARGERDEVREPTAQIVPGGAALSAAYTRADNGAVVATSKNPAYVVARENPDAEAEPCALALVRRLLDRYPQECRAGRGGMGLDVAWT